MADIQPISEQTPPERSMFRTTSWTAVVKAGRGDSPEAQEALAQLCRTYWQPVYAYLRRLGRGEDDARDLTQEFFYLLLSKNYLRVADRKKGKFRSFLLTAVNHFLANETDRARAAKRGGGQTMISLDETPTDDRPKLEIASELSPVKTFEQHWAMTLFQQVETKLRQEYAASSKAALFDRLREFVDARTGSGEYTAVAAELEMSPGAVAVAVHRLRQRFAELLRAEVAQTLVNPTAAEIEEERRHLCEIFSR